MSEEPETLAQLATRGDQTAICELMEQYIPRLEEFVRRRADRLVLAKESISDLVQSVCREVLESAHRFDYRGEKAFVRWFKVLALSKIVQKYRYYSADKRSVRREVDFGAMDTETDHATPTLGTAYATFTTPSRHAVHREELEQMARAFDELKEDYRDVILLARIWELPHAEVSELMGRSEEASRSLLKKAIAKLGVLMVSRQGD